MIYQKAGLFQNLLTGLRHSGDTLNTKYSDELIVSKPSNRSKAFRGIAFLRMAASSVVVSKPSNRSKAFRVL